MKLGGKVKDHPLFVGQSLAQLGIDHLGRLGCERRPAQSR